MPIQVIIIIILVVLAPVYGKIVVGKMTRKFDNMSPEELETEYRKGAEYYEQYFSLNEDEKLIRAIFAPQYKGKLLKGNHPDFLRDNDRSDNNIYLGLTDKNRFVVAVETQNSGEAIVGNASLTTRELPHDCQIELGTTLFPGEETTRKTGMFSPPMDLVVIKLPQNVSFGIWTAGFMAMNLREQKQKA